MTAARENLAVAYRRRAVRARLGADYAAAPAVRAALLRLAATYEKVADDPDLARNEDTVILYRQVSCPRS